MSSTFYSCSHAHERSTVCATPGMKGSRGEIVLQPLELRASDKKVLVVAQGDLHQEVRPQDTWRTRRCQILGSNVLHAP